MSLTKLTGAAFLAAAIVAQPGLAQTAPSLTGGGVVYAQYSYLLADTANRGNNFDVTRAYLNFNGRFDALTTRVTGDIYRVADGSLAYRLKYAFAAYTPKNSKLTFKFGQMQTAWNDFEETLWDYRMQGTTVLDRGDQATPLSYLSSSDFGLGIDGKWGPDRVNAQFTVLNGENYNRAPGDRRKDAQLRVSARVAKTDDSSRTGGLRLSAFGHLGKPTSGGTRQRALAAVSYRSRRATVAAEIAFTRDSITTPLLRTRAGRILSGFAVYRMPKSKVTFIGRVDVIDPNTGVAADRQTRIIAGASCQITPNLRLLLDLDHLMYEGGVTTPALEAVRSQALFQMQFTF
ncbi:MAG: hypothetical protein EXR93_04905 [Gemmatimonadetes bacterium]|nr:hypothetical protein [Gemmatimonadota bacterium]